MKLGMLSEEAIGGPHQESSQKLICIPFPRFQDKLSNTREASDLQLLHKQLKM